MIQLEFFPEQRNESEILRQDIASVKKSTDNVRKSLFARHGELAKKYIELHDRLEILERYICKKV